MTTISQSLRKLSLCRERLNLLAQAEPYIGKYYSQAVHPCQSSRDRPTGEMVEQDEIIAKEIEEGIIPDPSTIDPITGEPLPAMGEGDPAGAIDDIAVLPVQKSPEWVATSLLTP